MTKRSNDPAVNAATNLFLVVFLVIGLVGSWLILEWIGLSWALVGKLALLNLAMSLWLCALRELVKG